MNMPRFLLWYNLVVGLLATITGFTALVMGCYASGIGGCFIGGCLIGVACAIRAEGVTLWPMK